MEDIGFWLVIAFLFLAPWAVRQYRAPERLAWPVFILAIVLLALLFLGRVHLWLPVPVAEPLTVVLMLAIITRLAVDLFPWDRANRP